MFLQTNLGTSIW